MEAWSGAEPLWQTRVIRGQVPSKLEEAGYIAMEKEFRGKKPNTLIHLTDQGRAAFRDYKTRMQQILDDLPD